MDDISRPCKLPKGVPEQQAIVERLNRFQKRLALGPRHSVHVWLSILADVILPKYLANVREDVLCSHKKEDDLHLQFGVFLCLVFLT